MVFGLFRKGGRSGGASPPEGTVVYAVGDVHGCLGLLQRLQQQMMEDMAGRSARRRVVVYLGDYVDRGPDSCGVIEHLLSAPLPDCESVHLAGNHERWMLRFLDDAAVGGPWLRNGGGDTLMSYGLPSLPPAGADRLAAVRQQLRAALPQTHKAFLEGLALSHVEGDYFFAHAGVRPGVPLAEQSEDDLTWIREEFLYSNADFGKVVVHGHAPAPTPEQFSNRICVDTGAFMSGFLTAAILDGASVSFLHS